MDLEKLLAYHEGVELTGFNTKRVEGGWFVLIKGNLKGKPMVHFSGARYFADIWETITYEVLHSGMFWRPDKYAQ